MSCQPCGCDPEVPHHCERYPNCDWGRVSFYVTQPVSFVVQPLKNTNPTPQPSRASLPDDPQERKHVPIASGALFYFPDAIAEIALVSWHGNNQHNPGQPLHWARGKSTDHLDCIGRHLLQVGTRDTDKMRHSAKLAWRALANLQLEIELDRAAEEEAA